MNKEEVINRLKNGETISTLAKEYKVINEQISLIKRSLNIPTAKIIQKLKQYPNLREEITKLYTNSKTWSEFVNLASKLDCFNRWKSLDKRLAEIRNLYNLPLKMPENIYLTESDRIKGYIIRNSKFTAKRRGIEFNLTYKDFEIPTYCPILGIKLTYLSESNGNDPSHASLDRINNNKGYIKGNVIVISRLANAMKNEATFDQLLLFSTNIQKLINHINAQGVLGSITDIFDSFEPKLSLDY